MPLGPLEVAPHQAHVSEGGVHPGIVGVFRQCFFGLVKRLDPVLVLLSWYSDAHLDRTIEINPGEARMGAGKAWIDLECLFELCLRTCLGLRREYVGKSIPLEEEVIGPNVFRLTSPGCHLAILDNSLGHHCDNALGDFFLKGEDVLQCAIVSFRPEMGTASSINELGRDANALACATDTALDEVSNPERTPYLASVHIFPPKREGRVSRDDHELAKARTAP